MNTINTLFLLLLLIVINFSLAAAQETKNDINKQIEIEEVKPFDAKDYTGWQEIVVGKLSFYAPKDLKRDEALCYDSKCYSFKSEKFILDIDLHVDSYYPSIERKLSSYSEKVLLINEIMAVTWFFEKQERGFDYFAGMRFLYEKANNGFIKITDNKKALSMKLFFTDLSVKETAEKIFRSVQFKNTQEKNNVGGILKSKQEK